MQFLLFFFASLAPVLRAQELQNSLFISLNPTCNSSLPLLSYLKPGLPFPLRSTVIDILANHTAPKDFSSLSLRAFSTLSLDDRRDAIFTVLSASAEGIAGQVVSAIARHLDQVDLHFFTFDLPSDDSQLLTLARRIPCLRFPPEPDALLTPAVKPNDDQVADQWHLSSYPGVGAYAAWDRYSGHASDFVIGVVDTGCSAHPDLDGKMCYPESDDAVKCAGWDIADDDNNPHDEILDHVHGTPVSGCIAAQTHNQYGLAGMCWGCRIMCLKIMDAEGLMRLSSSIRAMNFMVGKGVRLSNHSYGTYSKSFYAMHQAIKALDSIGHLMVVSAGNDGCDIDRQQVAPCDKGVAIPAAIPEKNVISVGASNRIGIQSSFSNYGATGVHLFAPGSDILTLGNTINSRSGFETLHGTSFSAPLVTGAAALLWSMNPNMTHHEVREVILNSVHTSDHFSKLCSSGGILAIDQAGLQVDITEPEGSPEALPPPEGDRTAYFYDELPKGAGAGVRAGGGWWVHVIWFSLVIISS